MDCIQQSISHHLNVFEPDGTVSLARGLSFRFSRRYRGKIKCRAPVNYLLVLADHSPTLGYSRLRLTTHFLPSRSGAISAYPQSHSANYQLVFSRTPLLNPLCRSRHLIFWRIPLVRQSPRLNVPWRISNFPCSRNRECLDLIALQPRGSMDTSRAERSRVRRLPV